MGCLVKLTLLDVGRNSLRDVIPGALTLLVQMYKLSLSDNQLSGSRAGKRGGFKRPICSFFWSFFEPEIWEGDERRSFQCLKSGDSLNDQNLFTELSFL